MSQVWRDEVNLYLANGLAIHAEKVLNECDAGSLQLIELVEILGPGLGGTDAAEAVRRRSMQLISVVLRGKGQYSHDQLKFLVTFLTSATRLSDPVTIQSTIEATLALVNIQNQFVGFEIDVANAIFDNVHVQSSTQPIRHLVFVLGGTLIEKYGASLKQHFGPSFASHIVKQVDGEKDPRCLLQAFNLVKAVIDKFPIDGSTEDLFDITSCYFPITFNPPPNDEYGITREDLIKSLTDCLTATKAFAPLCFELIFDKLSSGVDEAKLQSYQLLTDCALAFGAEPLTPFLSHVYIAIRSELFQSFDKKLETKALECLSCVVQTLSRGVTSEKNQLREFLDPMIVEAIRSLSDFDVGLVNVNSRLLTAAAKASDSAASMLLKIYGKALLSKYNTDVSDEQRIAYIRSLSDIIVATTTSSPYGEDNVTAAIKEGILALINDACRRHATVHAAGFKCLVSLLSTGTLKPEETILFAVDATQAITEHNDTKVRDQAEELCVTMTKHYLPVAVETMLPKLAQSLLKGFDGADAATKEKSVIQALQAMAIDQATIQIVVQTFYSKLDTLCKLDVEGGTTPETMEIIAVAINQIVNSLLLPSEKLLECIILPCFTLYFANISNAKASTLLLRDALLLTFGKAVRSACQAMNVLHQEKTINVTLEIFGSGNLRALKLENSKSGVLSCKTEADELMVSLLASVVCSMTRDLAATEISLDLAESLLQFATKSKNIKGINAAAMASASIYNKIVDNDKLGVSASKAIAFLTVQSEEVASVCGAWLAKALVMRAHPAAKQLTDSMLATLNDPRRGKLAADGYRIIMFDHEGGLRPELFGVQTFMFKQRFFTMTLPALIEGFKSAQLEVKANFLLALSHILGAVPKQVLLSEVNTVWPLLMETLAHPEQGLSSSTLMLMKILIEEAQEVVAEHTGSLVSAMTALCIFPTMQVRMDALDCLEAIATLPSQKVYPYVESTIRDLLPILDDRKRLVRKRAVTCRTAWINLGGVV